VLIQIPDEMVQSPYFNLLSILMGEVGAGEYDYLTSTNTNSREWWFGYGSFIT
jgi:hypothetical protein